MEDDTSLGKKDYSVHTYAQSCKTLIPDAQHLEKLQDAVNRMHQVKLLAGELLTRHVHRCLDEKIQLPTFSQTWCRQLYKEVSSVSRAQVRQDMDDIELTKTMRGMEDEMPFERPSRSGLAQMLSAEAIGLKTTIHINITEHFKKRIYAFVRWTFHTDEERVMPPEEYKNHKLAMLQVAKDLLRTETSGLESPNEFHPWIQQYRSFFHLDALLQTDTFERVVNASPQLFLPAMRMMNRAFEGSGRHTFSLIPLTRRFRPGFVTLDVATWSEVLGIAPTESRKASLEASAKKRRQEQKDGTYTSVKEKKVQKQVEREEQRKLRDVELQKKKQMLSSETTAEKRKRLQEEKENREEYKRQKRVTAEAKRVGDQKAKDEFYASFANILPRKGMGFGYSIRTDGVSARLLFYKETRAKEVERSASLPRRGLYTIDEIKHMSRIKEENMDVIGIDPGKHDLICAVGDHYLTNPKHRFRYSAAQRRTDRCSTFYRKCMQKEKPDTVKHIEADLSNVNSRSSYSDRMSNYFCRRRHAIEIFSDFYGQARYRIRRWRIFKKNQKSIAGVINGLKNMVTDPEKVPILAYGSWAQASSTFAPKGIAPCIGIGLRRRLAKEFIVVDTPEHYTSKTCSKCHGECGPFVELEKMRRQLKKERAHSEEEKKKASRYTIRSVRRCQNAECGLILHRDQNAACNIATNFRLLYRGLDPLRKHSKVEEEMDNLVCQLCKS